MTFRTYLFILTITLVTSCELYTAEYYLKQAYDIGLTGNCKAAIPVYDKAIKKDPRLKEAYIQRGLCYESIGQDSLAINDYERLLSFDRKNTTALFYIGLCKYRQSKFQEAIDYYNKALETKGVSDPSDTSSIQIVIDYNKNGLLADQAAFDVPSFEIYYERGLAYYSTQQIQRAYADFQTCITQNYLLGECNYMVGLCWLTANKKDKACEAFRQGARFGDSLSIKQVRESCM